VASPLVARFRSSTIATCPRTTWAPCASMTLRT
jgi:hypothetical protein